MPIILLHQAQIPLCSSGHINVHALKLTINLLLKFKHKRGIYIVRVVLTHAHLSECFKHILYVNPHYAIISFLVVKLMS